LTTLLKNGPALWKTESNIYKEKCRRHKIRFLLIYFNLSNYFYILIKFHNLKRGFEMKKRVLFFSFLLLVCLLPINIFAEECIKGDCKNGLGTFVTDNGNKYIGEFKDGVLNGQATIIYSNGEKYVGECKNGNFTKGTYTYPNGQKYVGEWKDGKRHGQGTYTWPVGAKYEGGWKNNQKSGQGTLINADGTSYIGEWKDDKPTGKGNYTSSNGKKSAVEFKGGNNLKK